MGLDAPVGAREPARAIGLDTRLTHYHGPVHLDKTALSPQTVSSKSARRCAAQTRVPVSSAERPSFQGRI